ncbi:MAG: aminotransferase class III-fold pyridoxal phosphate-dependent enzyme [Xanthomonadales bacterium]|nr:aminotransferase class III-fold pyridoxal phosphate-dependent enzyme [Xanthomonadales bacterium]
MSLISQPPSFSVAQACALARLHYGVEASAEALPSERDQNFRLVTADGQQHVLKIANAAESAQMLAAENAALKHLAPTDLVPRLIGALDGSENVSCDGHQLRLISFLDGQPLGSLPYQSPSLLADVGRTVGRVSRALADFDHPALHRAFDWDLASAPALIESALPALADEELHELLTRILSQYREQTRPLLERLPLAVIHNDANDYNLIVRDQQVLGLIDFGDMLYSQRVNEVAVAMAYATLGKADPVAAAQQVVAGFHAEQPLEPEEMGVAFNLMTLRLGLSACMAARQQALRPDDPYLGISQAPLRKVLPALVAVHHRLGGYLVREACGLVPVPHTAAVVDYLRRNGPSVAPLTPALASPEALLDLDLSVGSPLVSSDPAQNEPVPLGERIAERLRAAGKTTAIGGYGEARLLYTEPAYRQGRLTDPQRSIHLGIDVSLSPGTPLHAPLDGVVHGFTDASARLDYGPMIVLRHRTDQGVDFYSLYGHLSADSLEGLQVGQRVARGSIFARVGSPPGNGDWWPHVHVQLITDLLDVAVNVDGACLPARRGTWMSLCPDPDWILRPARAAAGTPAPPSLLQRRQRIGANVRLSYASQPLQVVRGRGAYLYDQYGRTYIDGYNNVPHVGHGHPAVVAAVSEQLALLNTNTRYLQHQLLDYAEALCAQFPAELDTCFFVASGSEANELALRLARCASGARDLLVMDAAYHGHTSTLIEISPYKHDGPGGAGAPDWVHSTPIPDRYRGRFRGDDRELGQRYAETVGEVIDRLQARGRRLCGYIAETCPSVGGQLLLPGGYLAEVYRLVRAAGGVCIADEVQTGFGRLGTHFWGFEQHQVVPDIVVLGKPIANGYPLGAVVCRREIADAFNNGMEFFSTFGGSTAACAAGLATLQVVLEEGLQAHALSVGTHLLRGLGEIALRHPLVGDVRGSGLFLGVELVNHRTTLSPAADQVGFVAQRMRERGVLIGTDGPLHNVLKIRGPMPLAISDADLLLEALDQSLAETGPGE